MHSYLVLLWYRLIYRWQCVTDLRPAESPIALSIPCLSHTGQCLGLGPLCQEVHLPRAAW